MNFDEKNLLTEKMSEHYSNIFSPYAIEIFVKDVSQLLDINSIYRKSIKEWLNGKNSITDVTMQCLDKTSYWSLNEIAQELDYETPNIPVAAFLLSLYKDFPKTLSEIISVCGEICWCDENIIVSDNPKCSFAYLDEEYEQWFFMQDKSNEEDLKCHQLWQVLLQVPNLAPIVILEHKTGTILELQEDGKYLITSPDEFNDSETES